MRQREPRPETAAGEREHQPPPAGARAAAALQLQRSAGNHAVAALLARVPDPRLTHRPAGAADTPGLATQALPYRDPDNPASGWDAADVLNHLTQHDESSTTTSDEVRCAANAALAIAVTQGPQGVVRFAQRIEQRAQALNAQPLPAGGSAGELQRLRRMLESIDATVLLPMAASSVGSGHGHYGDLDTIANVTKGVMSADALAFSTGVEATAMAGAAGSTARIGVQITSRQQFQGRLAMLLPGDAYMVNVDTDVLAHGAATAIAQGNHFVTVGRERGAGPPRFFLYDPYPRTGDQYVLSTSPDFWTLFQNAEGDWKWVFIESLTRPAPGAP